MMRSSLLLLAGIALALMAAGDADAKKEPEWSYQTGGGGGSLPLVSNRMGSD